MADKQTFLDMGYDQLDGDPRLESLLATVKHQNYYKLVHPELYREFYDTDDPEERAEVRARTPKIEKDEYFSATINTFLKQLNDTGWYASMEHPRILFHNPIGKAFFQVSNDQLGMFLTLYGEKLGLPDNIVSQPFTPKSLFQTLRYRVRLEEMRSNLDRD